MTVILLAEGFEEIEALAPADLLRRAGIDVKLAGVKELQVTGAHGITVTADCALSEIDVKDLEMVVLPGGAGVDVLESAPAVRLLVEEAHARGKLIGAICAAPVLLAKWGLLTGRRAVCYPAMENKLIEYGARLWRDEKVTHDGSIITANAAGASVPFGLKLIAMLRGWEASESVRRKIDWHDAKPLT